MKPSLERLNAALLALMFLATLYQVVARTILGVSSVWTEELARFLFVWMVFLGAAALMKDDELIRISVLLNWLGSRGARILRILGILLTIPFILVLTWGAWRNTALNWSVFAPTIDWFRIGYVYLVIVLAGLLMLWYLLAQLVRGGRPTPSRSPTTGGGLA